MMLYEMLNNHVSHKTTSFVPLVDISVLITWLSISVIPVNVLEWYMSSTKELQETFTFHSERLIS